MAYTLKIILDFIMNFPGAISPLFMGTGWRPFLFQAYSIIVLSFASVYSIIGARKSSVVILSHGWLRIATAAIGLLYLVCHLSLIHLAPVNSSWIIRIIFVVIAYVAITILPYHIGNMITYLINRLGNGPFVIEVDEQGSRTDSLNMNDFWKPGPNFARRVVARYYLNGLFIPFTFLFLFIGIVPLQLLVLIFWLVTVVGLLFALAFRDPNFFGVLIGYLALLYLASNYSVIK